MAPGLVIMGMCNLGSGSLCQLNVDLGSLSKILTLPNLYLDDRMSNTSLKYVSLYSSINSD